MVQVSVSDKINHVDWLISPKKSLGYLFLWEPLKSVTGTQFCGVHKSWCRHSCSVSAVNHIIMPLISSFSYQFVFLFFLLFHLLAAFQSWDSLHGPSPAGDR